MVYCRIIGCKSRSERNEENITFHAIPKDLVLRQSWILATGRSNWVPKKYDRICSRHFSENCFRKTLHRVNLKEFSIPTLYVNKSVFDIKSTNCQTNMPIASTSAVLHQEDTSKANIKLECEKYSIENDMENYLRYQLVGNCRLKLKAGVIPHKFACQKIDRKILLQSSTTRKRKQADILEKVTTNENSKISFDETAVCHNYKKILDSCSLRNIKTSSLSTNHSQSKDDIDEFEENLQQKKTVIEFQDTNRRSMFVPFERNQDKFQKDKMTEIVNDASSIKEENITECRACLQQIYTDSTFYNIFDCLEHDGMDTTIAENLSKIANIQISETDLLPKVICQVCCALLQSACTFVSNVQKTEHILRLRIENVGCNGASEKVWPKPIQIDMNMQNSVYNTNKEIKEEVLSDEELAREGVQEQDFANLDIKIEPEELQTQHLSEIPRVNGTHSMDNLKLESKHLPNGNIDLQEKSQVDVKEEPASEDDAETTETDLSLECMLCTKTFNSVTGLKAHVIAQHSYKGVKRKIGNNNISPEKKKHNRYTCNTCRRNFTTPTDLMVHETCHNKTVCYRCNDSFDSFAQLTEHRENCTAISDTKIIKLKTLEEAKRPHSRESQNEDACTSYNMSTYIDTNEDTLSPMETIDECSQ